jgi:hypothetical protein
MQPARSTRESLRPGRVPVMDKRGWLKHGNSPGDPSTAPRCGARARTRGGQPCRAPAITGCQRCRMHGGNSTGPRTSDGLERSRRARWKHGAYSAERQRAYLQLKAECRAFNLQAALRHAAYLEAMRLLLKQRRAELRNNRRRQRRR